jgi:hypothetical protein
MKSLPPTLVAETGSHRKLRGKRSLRSLPDGEPLSRITKVDQGTEQIRMPEKENIERAEEDAREGKAPTTRAGEFVREEIHHVREGKHGARLPQQAIAIGLQSGPCWREASSSAQGNCFGPQSGKGKRSPENAAAVEQVLARHYRRGERRRPLEHFPWCFGAASPLLVGAVAAGVHAQCVHVVLPANEG